jgi:hypothetical protein
MVVPPEQRAIVASPESLSGKPQPSLVTIVAFVPEPRGGRLVTKI